MKTIQTMYFGEVEIDESSLLHFEEGMAGFADAHTYALLPFDEDEGGLMCLQSDERPELAFIVVNPSMVLSGYEPRLEEADERALEIGADTPVHLLAVVVVKSGMENCTANLKCPVVVNAQTLAAKQVVLPGEYSMRWPLGPQKKGA